MSQNKLSEVAFVRCFVTAMRKTTITYFLAVAVVGSLGVRLLIPREIFQ